MMNFPQLDRTELRGKVISSDHLVEYVDRMSGSLKAVNESKRVTNQLRAAE